MKRSTKFKCCGITSIVIGVILIGVGIGWPFIIDSLVVSQAKEEAALSSHNMDQWKGIPGKFDIQLNRNTYLFNVVNRDDVIFKGAVPKVEEYGPFIYREYDDYTTPEEWDIQMPIPGKNGQTAKAIKMLYNQTAKYNTAKGFVEKQDQDIDKPIWQINQAAQGMWFAATQPPAYRLALNLLYSVVLDGLGRQVVQTAGWTVMKARIVEEKDIGDIFFPNQKLPDGLTAKMFGDKYFGLGKLDNYIRWDALTYGQDPVQFQLMSNEIKQRFGLTAEQVEQVIEQWNFQTKEGKDGVIAYVPSQTHTQVGVAYAQWSNSFVTGNVSFPRLDSVTQQADTATGWPELSFFKIGLFNPTILPNEALFKRFENVKLYTGFGKQDIQHNHEHLFAMDDGKGGDPLPNSLFNIDTLQKFLDLGDQTIDVIEKPDTPADFKLDVLQPVSDLLTLTNEETYLVYMWLKYVKRDTFQRAKEGGSTKLGVLSQLTSQGFAQMMAAMEQEVPLIVYTNQLKGTLDTEADCNSIYTDKFGFTKDMAANLCSGGMLKIDTFSFQDKEKTCRAWVNVMLNNNTVAPENYADLVFLTSKTSQDLDKLIFYSTSKFQTFMQTNVFLPIATKYPKTCVANKDKMCTNKELAYQQWLDQSILPQDDGLSYMEQFPAYTKLTIRPELSLFMKRSGKPAMDPAPTIDNVFEMMQFNRFFNLEIVGDIILGKKDVKYTTVFTNDQFASYLRYVMIEVSLGGLFQHRTPREYIEGFFDPTVYNAAQTPMWNGGDQTNDPFMSINQSPTAPLNNPITFFTGHGDYKLTRSFGTWLDKDYITMKRKDYVNINELKDVYDDPWNRPDLKMSKLPLEGTDGMQFHPALEESDRLAVWVNDLGRNGYFKYLNDDYSSYDGLRMMTYQIDPSLMQKNNPDNAVFGTFLDGTSPMFSILQAPVLASKGHFYQIDDTAKDCIAIIYEKDSTNKIEPNSESDDTYLGMEQHSGVNIQARQRLQLNFYIKNEKEEKAGLFNFLQTDFLIIPLTYVKRESIMTKQNVRDILGPLYTAKTARTAGLATLLVVGVLLVALAIFMFIRFKKIKKQEEFGIFDTKKKDKDSNSNSQIGGQDRINDTKNGETLLGNSTSRDLS